MALLKVIFRSLKELFLGSPPKRRKPPAKAKKKVVKKAVKAVKPKAVKEKVLPKAVIKKSIKGRERSETVPYKEKPVKPRPEKAVGIITHYFPRIQVVVVKITAGILKIGDEIHIKGPATDFTQKVISLQIESLDVKQAVQGKLVGMKVPKECKVGDKVFKFV